MKKLIRNRWLVLLPSMLLVFALVAAACGDDDDDDDDDGSSSGGGSSEEQYVRGLCEAINDFTSSQDDAFAELEDADLDDLEDLANDAIDAMRDGVGDFISDVKELDPPSDLEDYHNSAVSSFEEIEEALEGDIDLFSDADPFGDAPAPELPSVEVQQKYENIAANEPACAGTDIFTTPAG